jgi:hypothetical protein
MHQLTACSLQVSVVLCAWPITRLDVNAATQTDVLYDRHSGMMFIKMFLLTVIKLSENAQELNLEWLPNANTFRIRVTRTLCENSVLYCKEEVHIKRSQLKSKNS